MIYPNFFQNMARGRFELQTDDLRVLLLDASYTFDPLHDARNDIPDASVVAETSTDLPNKSVSLVVDETRVLCDPLTLASVTGNVITQAVLYKRVSNPAQSWLVAHYPTLAGLPYTPTGGNIVLDIGPKVLSLGNQQVSSSGGSVLSVSTLDSITNPVGVITRTSANMFVLAVGSFTSLALPVAPVDGDLLYVKTSLNSTSYVLTSATVPIDTSFAGYTLSVQDESITLIYALGAWRIQ
jgi:hypothetical protein